MNKNGECGDGDDDIFVDGSRIFDSLSGRAPTWYYEDDHRLNHCDLLSKLLSELLRVAGTPSVNIHGRSSSCRPCAK